MKLTIYLFLVTGFTAIQAQDGKKLPSIKIPRTEIPEPDKKATKPPIDSPEYSLKNPFEPKLFKVPSKKYDPPQEQNTMQMNGGGSSLNPGKQYAEKLNKSLRTTVKEGVLDPKVFRKNQYFGDFETHSATVTLAYRDFGEIDGDQIKVTINGQAVAPMLFLEGNTKKIILGLTLGINHIEIEALNEGTLSPNTGEFNFYDDSSRKITGDYWGLGTGFKATFNIIKK